MRKNGATERKKEIVFYTRNWRFVVDVIYLYITGAEYILNFLSAFIGRKYTVITLSALYQIRQSF